MSVSWDPEKKGWSTVPEGVAMRRQHDLEMLLRRARGFVREAQAAERDPGTTRTVDGRELLRALDEALEGKAE